MLWFVVLLCGAVEAQLRFTTPGLPVAPGGSIRIQGGHGVSAGQRNHNQLPVAPNHQASGSHNQLPVAPVNHNQLPVQPQVHINARVPHLQLPQVQASFQSLPFQGSLQINNPISLEDLIDQEWLAFKLTYNKTYATPEIENFRKEVFIENRAKIARFNQDYANGRRTFVNQLNPYGDLLHHEFHQALNGFNRSSNRVPPKIGTTFIPSANVIFPDSMDWREVGAVSPVKSQGLCAGCYAFSAAGALEGHNFRKTGRLVELSPQNLIDCTKPQGNNGCQGGLMNPCFEYVRDNPGIDTDPSYPYEAKDGQCRFRPENVGAVCTGWVDIAEGDEKGLEVAIATLGPVSAAIDAGRDTFQFYSDGVYFDPECGSSPERMNHAVLIVGYGQEPDGQKYWLVKNSYGMQWGIGGYIKMAKDAGNHCGIATQASYPLV